MLLAYEIERMLTECVQGSLELLRGRRVVPRAAAVAHLMSV